jgi:hypothetical protein
MTSPMKQSTVLELPVPIQWEGFHKMKGSGWAGNQLEPICPADKIEKSFGCYSGSKAIVPLRDATADTPVPQTGRTPLILVGIGTPEFT